MNQWYQQLAKPSWAPPGWIFGPVWLVLYIVIVFTYGAAVLMFAKSQISWLVLLTLIWAMIAIYPFAAWIAVLNSPYLLWVAFATGLQLSITWMNRNKQAGA